MVGGFEMGWVGGLGLAVVLIGCFGGVLVGGFRLVIMRWLGLFVGLFFILWVDFGGFGLVGFGWV